MSFAVLNLALAAGFVAVQVSPLYSHLSVDDWHFALQGMVSVRTGNLFVFAIPWKNLIALKTSVHSQSSTSL